MLSFPRVVNRVHAGWIGRLLAMALLAACVLVLPGCGGVEGKYVAEQKGPAGETATFTLELKKGGVAVMTIAGTGMALPSVTGTYTVDGDKVTTNLNGSTDVLTYADGALTSNFFGEKLVLKRQ